MCIVNGTIHMLSPQLWPCQWHFSVWADGKMSHGRADEGEWPSAPHRAHHVHFQRNTVGFSVLFFLTARSHCDDLFQRYNNICQRQHRGQIRQWCCRWRNSVLLTIFAHKTHKVTQMERVSYQVGVGLKSNTTAVLTGRGKFGPRDIDTQGKVAMWRRKQRLEVRRHKEHLGSPGPGRGRMLP